MKEVRLRSAVRAAVLAVLLVANAAAAAPPGYNDKITPLRSVGSDTTYLLMQPVSDLFNESPGCTLNAANFSECAATQPAAVVTTENYDHDEVTQAAPYDVGSSNGIRQLCGTVVPLPPLKVHMARSSRGRGTAACELATNNQTRFTGFARDGLVVLVFPTSHTATQGSPAAGCLPGQVPPNCTGAFRSAGTRRLSKQNLIAVFSSGTVDDWCQLNNGTVDSIRTNANDPQDDTPAYFPKCATPQPIITWRVNTGAGTYASWNTFLGVADSNARAVQPPAGSIPENNARPIKDAGTAIQQNSIFYGSSARFTAQPLARRDGGTVRINNGPGTEYVPPAMSTINDGTYAAIRTLYNVTLNPANPPPGVTVEDGHRAAQAFVDWLCQTDHAVSEDTGNNYNTDLQKAFERLFFVRLGGRNSAGMPNAPCTAG